jgi:segregation and condensation protein A
VFLQNWETVLHWTDFEQLVTQWCEVAPTDLDTDRVGVFWALLFLSSQGQVELQQEGNLHGPLQLKRLLAAGTAAQLPISQLDVPDAVPAEQAIAA